MSNIAGIRNELLRAISMLETVRKQKPSLKVSKADRLIRMQGGIVLAEMYIEKAKELLSKEQATIAATPSSPL